MTLHSLRICRWSFGWKVLIAAAIGAMPAKAQNLAGVMIPVVNEDQSSAEIRLALVPGLDATRSSWAARIHYQRSLSDAVSFRRVLQGVASQGDGFRLNGIQGEAVWQMTPDRQPLQLGLRADVRAGWSGLSDAFALNLAGEYRIDDRWAFRGQVRSIKLIDAGAPQALQWQTRGHIVCKLKGADLALEYYGSHRSFSDDAPDAVQVGPALIVPAGRLYVRGGLLAGVSGRVPESEARLWIGYRF